MEKQRNGVAPDLERSIDGVMHCEDRCSLLQCGSHRHDVEQVGASHLIAVIALRSPCKRPRTHRVTYSFSYTVISKNANHLLAQMLSYSQL